MGEFWWWWRWWWGGRRDVEEVWLYDQTLDGFRLSSVPAANREPLNHLTGPLMLPAYGD